ncbi:aminopeptidase P family protein [Sphingosinicella sp. BN140058]|uniref:aminopeptidase P family protein n=1 Tax=Sphingosinicella sp. BN140058 TaxID=1892855 RepID=UPI001012E235|nr:aminopeptidase P family protein [Sphingosinicella sp. BN140058]QAY77184.1 aminopeptidase P family protein [Sphingosinicella sp. BN140058]
MSTYEARLQALREQLKADRLDGFVVPLTDEHMSEYVGSYAQRLAWLTGFQGSAGSAVVLPQEAAIFTDGRYTLQVRDQVDGQHWSYQSVPQTSVADWLKDHAPNGGRIGYDPWLHTRDWVARAREALAARGAELVAVERNPIDRVWSGKPAPSPAKLVVHGDALAGKSSAAKRQEMADWLKAEQADAAVLSALDSIAWTFNVRGQDVEHTPVALSFALVHHDGTADLFVASEKLGEDVRQHLGNGVRIHERDAFEPHLRGMAGKTVIADPERAVAAIFGALEAAGARTVAKRDPAVLPKAIKNPVEIAGHHAAQARDGAALTRFLHWLSIEAPGGQVDELSAAAKLQDFRQACGDLRDTSFDTISGAGPNGAIVHYRVTEDTNRRIEMDSLYLVDSGGQYPDGTTDVTRTVAIGTPSAEMRDRFTRVLKGHIAISAALFPDGTRGSQLDTLARQFLWQAGVDYAHGTGHGVGSYLAVHEGPQRIAPVGSGQAGGDEPLRAGMILSNEPGYYKTGAYGIRIENLVLVVPRDIDGAEKPMLGFENLTWAPIDRTLIDLDLLTREERAWVDSYHARVLEIVGPQLDGEVLEWARAACAPL